ncbi:hypothetical protein BGZ58_005233 [Dissophora ornata]|nr:hypothetical protein BGZ58_005233 [Dissophora ornata]
MHEALDLPEIRTLIGHFALRSSLPALGLWPSRKNLIWDAIAQCPQLEKLEVMNIKIEHEELGDPNAFWRACANASWLRLDSVMFMIDLNIPTVAMTSAAHRGEKKEHNETKGFFPKVRHLGLRIGDDLDTIKQLELMQQCSNMRSLDWAPPSRTFTSRACLEMIQSSGSDLLWPKLDTLYMSGKDIHDHDVATMLKSINCVIKLAAGYSGFSSGAFRALRPHFTTLKVLDLQNCLETDATMTQEILTKCPHLTLFYGRVIWMNDLIGDTPEGEIVKEHTENRLKPWVCPNLKSFEIGSVLVEGGLSLSTEELLRRKEVLLRRLQWLTCLQEYDRMCLQSHFTPQRQV